MNKLILHGRLARDPEFIEDKTDEKKNRCKFTVATDRRYGDEADFHNCIVFGKRASVVDKYFLKGSEIVLEGELQGSSYEKDGEKRKSWTCVVSDFDFCGSKDSGNGDSWEQADEDNPF